jgi:hypothetical protein
VKDCVIESYTIPDSLKIAWFRADTLVTMNASNVVSKWGDAYNKNNDAIRIGSSAAYNPTLVEADGIKRIHFPPCIYQWTGSWGSCFFDYRYYSRQNLPGSYGEGLQFDGGSLVNSSYSIIAVVQMKEGYFLTGSSIQSLTIGYGTTDLWTLNHKRPFNYSYTFDQSASVSNPNNYLQLFTMIYNSRDSSMRIFVNGNQRGETKRGIAPLSSFPAAMFGAWCTNTSNDRCGGYNDMHVQAVNISEVIILQKALTSDQRKLYEDQLKEKYDLPSFLFE